MNASRHDGSPPSGALLSVRGLSVSYGRVSGVEDLSLQVEDGEAVALVGPNGAGKTSTLSAVAGLLPRSGVTIRGDLRVGGTSVRGWTPWDVAQLGVAMIPAITKVFGHLNVKEHFQLAAGKQPAASYTKALDDALALFPALGDRLATPAAALSGGERQMLALAAATMRRPRLLMIDELSQGLSPAAVSTIVQALLKLKAEGLALLVVEQSLSTALSLADRCYALESGRVTGQGPAADFATSESLTSSYLGRSAGTGPADEDVATTGEPCLRIEQLSVRFRGLQALADVDLDVYPGQTVGLVGPNGAGKSTLLNCINMAVRPTSGRIWLKGRPTENLRPHSISARGVARTFQSAELWKGMHVLDVVALGTHSARLRRREAVRRAREALEFVGLEGVENSAVRDLPYGHAKLVDLARALASSPEILLLDEPASGLTQLERTAMARILRRISEDRSTTTLVVEHDMQMVRECCPRLVVLSHGRVIASGPPQSVLAEARVADELLGLKSASA